MESVNKLSTVQRAQILHLLYEGNSFRRPRPRVNSLGMTGPWIAAP